MRIRPIAASSRTAARAGFTLMEVLVAVTIVIILMGVGVTTWLFYLDQSRLNAAKIGATELAGEINRFKAVNGDFPPPGTWDLLPLTKEPVDPWNEPYRWNIIEHAVGDGSAVVTQPLVWSIGPNKVDESGGGDDITNQ